MHGSARKRTAGLTLASSIEWKDDDRRHAIQRIWGNWKDWRNERKLEIFITKRVFCHRETGNRVWRENVLKDWHAIRFDRRPPAARAPTTTRPPRRRWRFATRCDASDVSRHLVDGDWRASTMHCIVETPTEKHPMLSIEIANFFFSFSIHLFINIIDFMLYLKNISFLYNANYANVMYMHEGI